MTGTSGGDRSLTRRELEVLLCAFKGDSNKAMARQLNISPLTIKNHVQKIRLKLKVPTREAAVYRALQLGILVAPTPEIPDAVIATPVYERLAPQPVVVYEILDWFKLGNIEISKSAYKVRVDGVEVKKMHGRTFAMLACLIEHGERVSTYDHLANVMQRGMEDVSKNNVTMQVLRLRAILDAYHASHTIATEYGVGYVIKECGPTPPALQQSTTRDNVAAARPHPWRAYNPGG